MSFLKGVHQLFSFQPSYIASEVNKNIAQNSRTPNRDTHDIFHTYEESQRLWNTLKLAAS